MSESHPSPAPRRAADIDAGAGVSIRVKQTAFAALVVVLTGGILTLACYGFVRRSIREQIDRQLELTASARHKLLTSYI